MYSFYNKVIKMCLLIFPRILFEPICKPLSKLQNWIIDIKKEHEINSESLKKTDEFLIPLQNTGLGELFDFTYNLLKCPFYF